MNNHLTTYTRGEKVPMPKNSTATLWCLTVFLLVAATYFVGPAKAESDSTQQAIQFLIGTVAHSNLVFIRNGKSYNSAEAAEHIREKYEYFRSRIENPQDFIRLCASKSLLSGKPYLVVTAQGTIPVAKWLEQKLAEYLETLHHG